MNTLKHAAYFMEVFTTDGFDLKETFQFNFLLASQEIHRMRLCNEL